MASLTRKKTIGSAKERSSVSAPDRDRAQPYERRTSNSDVWALGGGQTANHASASDAWRRYAKASPKDKRRRGVKETASWKREAKRFCVGDQNEISIILVDEGLSFVATKPCEFTLRWAGIVAFGAWVRAMIPDEE